MARAAATMVLIEASLRLSDLPATCRRFGVRWDLDSAAPPAAEPAVLPRRTRAAVRAAQLVLARWPAGDTCLRRCLLLGHRLRRLRPVLRIGVKRDAAGEFSAHSWLEIDGRTLDPSASAYAPLGAAGR
ncbi:hypothetical protein BAY60_07205 [Prauserella muralis]|uniref:Microcin J25-processing protein McjB C-terminal domain-containing protein n=1 Tax=Prauserella muralis TaxID=588067 RepID=A0A2V4BCL5_9PSEU|nr:hypothetical protein BAY60_07205 [Prauserella muralis]